MTSHCDRHDTYPAKDEPCWQCVNPYVEVHETFLVRLCEILKVPYEDTSEEDILAKVKELKDGLDAWIKLLEQVKE